MLNSDAKVGFGLRTRPRLGMARRELDLARILRLAHEELRTRLLGLFDRAARVQPIGALDNVEAADRDEHGRNDRRGEHPAPGREVGQSREDEVADRGAAERADRLEGESGEHKLAAAALLGMFSEMIICAVG